MKLILGTVQFGLNYGVNNGNGKTKVEEVFRILDFALQNGISRLDTAANYGNAEEVLGKYFEKYPTKRFEIVTKFNLKNSTCQESLKSSISKLNVESINSIMFHSFEEYIKYKCQISDLNRNFKGILFEKLGVSVYTNDQIEALITDPGIDLIQAPFNMLDNENERGEIFMKIIDSGKELHTRSVFLQGLFFLEIKKFPESLKPLIPYVQQLHDLAKKNQISIGEMALSYVLSKKYIDGVLFGVDSLSQIRENVKNSLTILSEDTIKQIDSIKTVNVALLNPSLW